MFKRLARVLFVAAAHDPRLPEVLRLARDSEFSQWLDVRALAASAVPDATALEWADLLIVFDREFALVPDAQSLAQAGCKLRVWDLPAADADVLPEAVVDRLRGVVGGLRLLARMAPVGAAQGAGTRDPVRNPEIAQDR